MKQETRRTAEYLSTLLAQAGTLEKADSIAAEAGILAQVQANAAQTSCSTEPASKIGIWERKQENGEAWYVRTPNSGSFGFWSSLERIGPKRSHKRILLFGESVARGICYDPFFTPAMALEKILSAIFGESVEVIDLARTDIGIWELYRLIESALTLSPDAVVVFAGNNWRLPDGTVNLDLAELARNVEKAGDWSPITEKICEEVKSGVRAILSLLGRIVTEKQIPVVFLIPEFNLLDWQNEFCGQAPVASGTELIAWEDWRKQAKASLAEGNIPRAAELAQRMIAADRGTLPVGYEILAHCKLIVGETSAARTYSELARDASHSLPIHLSPRCYSIIQQLLRQEAPGCGIHLVDLPGLFADLLRDELPGRKLFLDYCHLNSEGIRLAMAAAAKELYGCFAGATKGQEAFSVPITLDRTTEAHAHFLAAIHNARCGQEYDIVRYHCDSALQHDAPIGQTMFLHLQACLESAPLFMTKSFWHLPGRSREAMSWSLRSLNRDRGVNLVIVNAIVDALESVMPGSSARVADMLHREFSLKDRTTSLLTKPFCNPVSFQPERDWEGRTINFRAFSRCSSFWFIGETGRGTQISMMYRVPHATPESGHLRVFANDQLMHVCPASAVWCDTTFVLPPELATKSPIRLLIEWPDPTWTKEQRVGELVTHLQQGPIEGALMTFPESFATFGEIQLFTAKSHAQSVLGDSGVSLNDRVMIQSRA